MTQFDAARVGDLEWFDNNKFDINAKDEWGATALIHASWKGHKTVAFKLIEAGADLEIRDNDDDTALILACRYNRRLVDPDNLKHSALVQSHIDIAIRLIESGAELDNQDKNSSGSTVLHLVTYSGHKDIVFKLIEHGADLDIQDDFDKTAFAFASRWGEKSRYVWAAENGKENVYKTIADAIESWKQTPRSLKYTTQMYIRNCNSVPHILLQRNSIEKEINMDIGI